MNKKNTSIMSNFKGKPKRPAYSILNSLSIQKKLDVKFKNWEYYFLKINNMGLCAHCNKIGKCH